MRPKLALMMFGGRRAVDASAALYFARSGGLSAGRKAVINALITGLKADGIWTSLDALWLIANETETAACANLVSSSFTLLPISGIVFSPDRGYTGDGTADCLNTQATLGSLTLYTQNSCHIMGYSRTSRTSAAVYNCLFGCASSSGNNIARLIPIGADGNARRSLNSSGADVNSGDPANEQGIHILDRAASTGFTWEHNGSTFASVTSTSVARPTQPLYLLADNIAGTPSNFSSSQIAAASIGASLGAAGRTALRTRIETYLDAIGAGVL